MKRFSPDMEVVRFGAEDIIVTSGAADLVFDAKMENGIAGDGTVTFNGFSYTMNDYDDLNNIGLAIDNKYGKDSNDMLIGNAGDYLLDMLDFEISTGLGTGWAGSYKYDANSNTFIKQ